MNTVIRNSIFALGMVIGMQATAATIIPANLDVDFRNAPWTSGAHGNASYADGNTTATAGPNGATLFANDALDGLGVLGGEIDEIDNQEFLRLDFATAIDISTVWITDLFAAPDGGNNPDGEMGFAQVFFDDATSVVYDFIGNNSDQSNGEQSFNIAGTGKVSYIKFWAADYQNNEFSVAGFNVPEPSALILFGLGLAGLGAVRRKQA